MKQEVLDYIGTMSATTKQERTQEAIVSLLYELVNKETVTNAPVVMSVEETPIEVKKPTKKKKVKKDDGIK